MLLVPFQWVLCRYILFAKIRKNSKQSKCVTRDRPHLSKEEGIFAYEQLAGKPGSADEKTRAFFLVATGECIFQIWVVLMASIYSCVFCPFSMMRNQGFDEVKGPKNLGRHQRSTALGDRSSAMSAGPARPTRSSVGVPALETWLKHSASLHKKKAAGPVRVGRAWINDSVLLLVLLRLPRP